MGDMSTNDEKDFYRGDQWPRELLNRWIPALVHGRYVSDGYGDHYRDTWIDYYHD